MEKNNSVGLSLHLQSEETDRTEHSKQEGLKERMHIGKCRIQ